MSNEQLNDRELLLVISTKLDEVLRRLDAADGKIASLDTRVGALERWQSSLTGTGAAARVSVDQVWKLTSLGLGILTIAVAVYAALKP